MNRNVPTKKRKKKTKGGIVKKKEKKRFFTIKLVNNVKKITSNSFSNNIFSQHFSPTHIFNVHDIGIVVKHSLRSVTMMYIPINNTYFLNVVGGVTHDTGRCHSYVVKNAESHTLTWFSVMSWWTCYY